MLNLSIFISVIHPSLDGNNQTEQIYFYKEEEQSDIFRIFPNHNLTNLYNYELLLEVYGRMDMGRQGIREFLWGKLLRKSPFARLG